MPPNTHTRKAPRCELIALRSRHRRHFHCLLLILRCRFRRSCAAFQGMPLTCSTASGFYSDQPGSLECLPARSGYYSDGFGFNVDVKVRRSIGCIVCMLTFASAVVCIR